MSGLPGSLKGIAKTVIERFGEEATLKQHTQGSYSVDSGKRSSTPSSETVQVFMEAYNSHEMTSNPRVEAGDRKAHISAENLNDAPKPKSTLEMDSEVWRIVATDAEEVEGVQVLYTCQVRREH